MLEIIAIIILGKKLADIAEQKGQSRRKWRWLFLLCWIGAELFGAIVGMLLFQQMFAAMLIGIGCAITVYILMKNYLEKLPDEFDKQDLKNLDDKQKSTSKGAFFVGSFTFFLYTQTNNPFYNNSPLPYIALNLCLMECQKKNSTVCCK